MNANLTTDLERYIVGFLNVFDVLSCLLVCKRWNEEYSYHKHDNRIFYGIILCNELQNVQLSHISFGREKHKISLNVIHQMEALYNSIDIILWKTLCDTQKISIIDPFNSTLNTIDTKLNIVDQLKHKYTKIRVINMAKIMKLLLLFLHSIINKDKYKISRIITLTYNYNLYYPFRLLLHYLDIYGENWTYGEIVDCMTSIKYRYKYPYSKCAQIIECVGCHRNNAKKGQGFDHLLSKDYRAQLCHSVFD